MLLHELGYSIYRAHFKQMWVSESEMNDFLESCDYPTGGLSSLKAGIFVHGKSYNAGC